MANVYSFAAFCNLCITSNYLSYNENKTLFFKWNFLGIVILIRFLANAIIILILTGNYGNFKELINSKI